MAQLEVITEFILSSAKQQAEEIMKEAQEKYAAHLASYEQQGLALEDELLLAAKKEAENKLHVAESAVLQKNAQRLLAYKVETVEKAISAAETAILEMDDSTYCKHLCTLLQRYEGKVKDGELLLNEKDAAREMPAFTDLAKQMHLTVSDRHVPISGGFILKCGKVEENCSLEALIRDKKEELTDMVSGMLF